MIVTSQEQNQGLLRQIDDLHVANNAYMARYRLAEAQLSRLKESFNDPTAEALNALCRRCHADSWNAGWYHDLETGILKANIPEKMALIHSEVSEALEGHRKDLMDDKLPHRKAIEVELADAVIRIGDLCGFLGLDLGGAVIEKLAYNRAREDHKIENRRAAGGKEL